MVTIAQLTAKVEAFIEAISTLTRGQLLRKPPASLALDYNRARVLLLELFPTLDERIIGPRAETVWHEDGEYSAIDYATFRLYALEILKQLQLLGLPDNGPGNNIGGESLAGPMATDACEPGSFGDGEL
jgi:hypothetical protein